MAKAIKSTITHPRSGRDMKIDTVIYESVNKAILQSLKGSNGKTFSELSAEVEKIVKRKTPDSKVQYPGTPFPYFVTWKQKALQNHIPKKERN